MLKIQDFWTEDICGVSADSPHYIPYREAWRQAAREILEKEFGEVEYSLVEKESLTGPLAEPEELTDEVRDVLSKLWDRQEFYHGREGELNFYQLELSRILADGSSVLVVKHRNTAKATIASIIYCGDVFIRLGAYWARAFGYKERNCDVYFPKGGASVIQMVREDLKTLGLNNYAEVM